LNGSDSSISEVKTIPPEMKFSCSDQSIDVIMAADKYWATSDIMITGHGLAHSSYILHGSSLYWEACSLSIWYFIFCDEIIFFLLVMPINVQEE